MKVLLFFLLGLLALPLALLFAALEGFLPTNSVDNPSRWESSIAMKAVDASLDRRAEGQVSPFGAKDSEAIAKGRTLFAAKCSACHGGPHGPSNLGANGLYPRAPQFFEEGSDVDAAQAYAAIRDGIRYSGMPAWNNDLTDAQMWEVATFVVSVRPRRPMAHMP